MERFLAGAWRARGPAPLHMDVAVARIWRALRAHERIVVYGDFDCDGITSCALLTVVLRVLGGNVESYIPRREDDGRGLNVAAVRALAGQQTSLIITTDCGTANVAEVELARDLGMDVVVTDHHPPRGPIAPAHAVVNPQQAGDQSIDKDLAGVGVAFRVVEALLTDAQADLSAEEVNRHLTSVLDLVAVGTIADIVPLSPMNWALVRAGLARLAEMPRPGLRALLPGGGGPSDVPLFAEVARDVSFAVAPRLNAGGRLGQPMLPLGLLVTEDAAEVAELAEQLELLNQQRQRGTEAIVTEAREQALTRLGLARDTGAPPADQPTTEGAASPTVLVAMSDDWSLGLLGLAAGRLAEEYHCPAFVIRHGDTECRGSGRAPRGFDLGAALAECATLFTRFGGHAQAAGFTFPTERLNDFEAFLRERFSRSRTTYNAPAADAGVPQAADASPIEVDCRLPLHRVVSDVYDSIDSLAPFGPGWHEPRFHCARVRVLRCWRSGPEGRNLRLTLQQGKTELVASWPRQGHLCDHLRMEHAPVDLIYTIRAYRRRNDDTLAIEPVIITMARTR